MALIMLTLKILIILYDNIKECKKKICIYFYFEIKIFVKAIHLADLLLLIGLTSLIFANKNVNKYRQY